MFVRGSGKPLPLAIRLAGKRRCAGGRGSSCRWDRPAHRLAHDAMTTNAQSSVGGRSAGSRWLGRRQRLATRESQRDQCGGGRCQQSPVSEVGHALSIDCAARDREGPSPVRPSRSYPDWPRWPPCARRTRVRHAEHMDGRIRPVPASSWSHGRTADYRARRAHRLVLGTSHVR